MDLNEKIAARRREIQEELVKAQEAEKQLQKKLADEAARKKSLAQAKLDTQVSKRLSSMGLEHLSKEAESQKTPDAPLSIEEQKNTHSENPPRTEKGEVFRAWDQKPDASDPTVDAEVDKVLTAAASSRWTTGENALLGVMAILGLLLLFSAWPIGLCMLVFCGFYTSSKNKKYKKLILSEAKNASDGVQ